MKVCFTRTVLCSLSLSVAVSAQCPPPGGYPPPPPPTPPVTGWTAGGTPGNPSSPSPAGPSAPSPSGPKAPAPEEPNKGAQTPRAPMPGIRMGPRTGGLPITLTRSDTSKDRLRLDWRHPVPPRKTEGPTAAVSSLPLEEALALMWEDGDQRPLLVLRECKLCKDGDEALLSRALINDRTLLLASWFRTVRLPAHVAETGHAFYNVFGGYGFEGAWPHFFLLAHPGAKPVTFTGQQTQAQLWKGMQEVLSQRYAKDPAKAVKEWLSLLDSFDTLDLRRRQLQEQLDEARAADGPDSPRTKKLAEALARNNTERDQALAQEAKIRDLGLVPIEKPKALGAAIPAK